MFDRPTRSESYVRYVDERADTCSVSLENRETSVRDGDDRADAKSDQPKKRETSVRSWDEKVKACSDRPTICETFVRPIEDKTDARSNRDISVGQRRAKCPPVPVMKGRTFAPTGQTHVKRPSHASLNHLRW